MNRSQVPGVVEEWKSDLRSKNRQKLADRIASPADHPELFEEGWEPVLKSERSSSSDAVLVDV